MSCEKNPDRAGQAGRKAGLPGPVSRAAFYAGVGLTTGGAVAGVYSLWRARTDQADQQRVRWAIGKIQNGARQASTALAAQTPGEQQSEILNDAAYELVEAWAEVKKMKDKDPIKSQLANFTADVMGAVEDTAGLLKQPGNVAGLDRVRRVFRGSQVVFVLPRRSPGNSWRTSLLIGGVVGLAVAGGVGLVRRQRAKRKLAANLAKQHIKERA